MYRVAYIYFIATGLVEKVISHQIMYLFRPLALYASNKIFGLPEDNSCWQHCAIKIINFYDGTFPSGTEHRCGNLFMM